MAPPSRAIDWPVIALALCSIASSTVMFMNVQVLADGSIEIQEPLSKAGDYILLEALDDLLVAASACPQDQNPCNGWNPTDLRIEIYSGS